MHDLQTLVRLNDEAVERERDRKRKSKTVEVPKALLWQILRNDPKLHPKLHKEIEQLLLN